MSELLRLDAPIKAPARKPPAGAKKLTERELRGTLELLGRAGSTLHAAEARNLELQASHEKLLTAATDKLKKAQALVRSAEDRALRAEALAREAEERAALAEARAESAEESAQADREWLIRITDAFGGFAAAHDKLRLQLPKDQAPASAHRRQADRDSVKQFAYDRTKARRPWP